MPCFDAGRFQSVLKDDSGWDTQPVREDLVQKLKVEHVYTVVCQLKKKENENAVNFQKPFITICIQSMLGLLRNFGAGGFPSLDEMNGLGLFFHKPVIILIPMTVCKRFKQEAYRWHNRNPIATKNAG